jgi:hypothetical protein
MASDSPKPYEAPSVEEIGADGYPISTVAGISEITS